jgi:hypothetical protein
MEVNPFAEWVREMNKNRYSYADKRTFYVPDKSVLPLIYKHFGIKDPSVLTEDNDVDNMRMIKSVFFRLWNEAEFVDHNVKFDDKTVDGCALLGTEDSEDFILRFVDGFISKTHLNVFLKRALKGENRENDKNPFNVFTLSEERLPDVTYLPTLYKALGVKNFAEMRLTQADYESAFGDTKDVIRDNILRVHFGNNPPVGIVWQWSDRTYLESFPPLVVKRLAARIENLKKAGQGKAPLAALPRDILQTISNPDLKGKNLIGLCIQNVTINRFCNQNDQQLFKDRLLSEFNEVWQPGLHGYPTPRELYVQMHKRYYEVVIPDVHYYGFRLDELKNGDSGVQTPIVRVVPDPVWTSSEDNLRHKLFFFPAAPELSFLAVMDMKSEIVRLSRMAAIEKYVERKELNSFVLSCVKFLSKEGGNSLVTNAEGPKFVTDLYQKIPKTVVTKNLMNVIDLM